MWEHTRDVHGGQLGDQQGLMDYRFKVTNVFRKCLQRQIDEGLRIIRNENEGCTILNGKNVFYTLMLIEPNFRQM